MEFNLYVSKIKKKAVVFLSMLLLSFVTLAIAIETFALKSALWVCFLILFICIVIYIFFFYKNEYSVKKEFILKPFEIKINPAIKYSDIYSALEKNCNNNECFKFSENSAFFRLKNKYIVRIILYRTEEFNKKDYDEEKKKINRKANKIYNISQWVSIHKSRKQMRINLIYTDCVNETLSNYISGDAEILLTRVEGIINLIVSNGKLIVPPLQPTFYMYAIDRYKDMVRMISNMLSE